MDATRRRTVAVFLDGEARSFAAGIEPAMCLDESV